MRQVYIILSARALPYASRCVATLLSNCQEPVNLWLLTDGPDDKEQIETALSEIQIPSRSRVQVADKAAADARAEDKFAPYPHLRAFRDGHPCWRKITDPLLFANDEDEVIILDPDLYFPNRFTFETTLENGLLLMHQGPNCLYPPDAVWRVFSLNVPLARHVDIGVAQVRAGAIDLKWLDWFVGALGCADFEKYMHIEAIVWSALAMRMGGGHYDPSVWRCWQRGQIKRLLIAAGVKGTHILRLEPLSKIKCIHVSGPSKWWVVEAEKSGVLTPILNLYDRPSDYIPFVELSERRYRGEQLGKKTLERLGYYRLSG